MYDLGTFGAWQHVSSNMVLTRTSAVESPGEEVLYPMEVGNTYTLWRDRIPTLEENK